MSISCFCCSYYNDSDWHQGSEDDFEKEQMNEEEDKEKDEESECEDKMAKTYSRESG